MKSESRGFPFDQQVVWEPTPEQKANCRLAQFCAKFGFLTLEALEERANSDPAWFWEEVLSDLEIEFSTPYSQVLDTSSGIQRPRWCVDGRMNIVQNCLDKWQRGDHFDPLVKTAIVSEREDGSTEYLTYSQLQFQVCQGANALRQVGLGVGDVIGICMPMTGEAVVALLAILKVGGIVLPLFSGFGAAAMAARLDAGQAKGLIVSAEYQRNGKLVDLRPAIDEISSQVPSLILVLLEATEEEYLALDSSVVLHQWRGLRTAQPQTADNADTGADDPCMIIYTSGTTGPPKGILHAHCGFPLKAAQDMAHGFDVGFDDTVFWYTDLGWMMGPWVVLGTLLLGGRLVLYDGAPAFPRVDRLWELSARHAVTLLGITPTVARIAQGAGSSWLEGHDLSALRAIGSAGSAWDTNAWMWVFQNVLEARKPIFNYTGGTEVSGGIVGCTYMRGLKPCSFNMAMPGMYGDVVDEAGNSLIDEVGEFVVRQPWIGMARGFWRDEEDRYTATYWAEWPHLWKQGDLAARDSEGYWFVIGRSDDTMLIAAKRIGPGEYEEVLVGQPAVLEAAVVGVPDPVKGQMAVCFCVLQPGEEGTPTLRATLLDTVAQQLGKPLRPADLLFVPQLPKTRSSKLMRRLIQDIYLDRPLGDISNLDNEEALETLAAAISQQW